AVAVPPAPAGAVAGLPAVVPGLVLVVVPRGRVTRAPAAARGEAEVARKIEIDQPARAAARVHPGGGDVEDHLGIALVAGEYGADVIRVQAPHARIDDLLRPVGGVLPFGRLLEETGPPQVQVGQGHLGRAPGGPAPV